MKNACLNTIFLLLMFCVLATSSSAQKKLTISSNHRFFADENGNPFFWLGDTGWLLFLKLNREDAEKYLEDRKQKGYNVIQAMVLHNIAAANVYGDSALLNKNVSTPLVTPGNNFSDHVQYDYWDHIDYIIDLAAKKKFIHGIGAGMGN